MSRAHYNPWSEGSPKLEHIQMLPFSRSSRTTKFGIRFVRRADLVGDASSRYAYHEMVIFVR